MKRVFTTLRSLRAFERRHLAYLRTIEDHDLVLEIGFHQSRRKPLTMKQLFLLDIGSVATVQRRVRRLRHLGILRQRRCKHDRRAIEVRLTPKVLKVFAKYDELLGAPHESAGAG